MQAFTAVNREITAGKETRLGKGGGTQIRKYMSNHHTAPREGLTALRSIPLSRPPLQFICRLFLCLHRGRQRCWLVYTRQTQFLFLLF